MTAIETLAGGIAHDVNNLLMAIQGNVSLLLVNMADSHPFYEKLIRIEACVKNGAKLTRQLLGFATGGKYALEPTNLNKMTRQTASVFAHDKKGLTLQEKYQKDIWLINADRDQLVNVLLNLFENAWQAMPGGGCICLHTRNIILDRHEAEAHDREPGKFVSISVSDSGCGMEKAVMERIFEPFFTTKQMGRGTGLGLAFVSGVIRNHGGAVTVSSELQKGSRFTIYLPVRQSRRPST